MDPTHFTALVTPRQNGTDHDPRTVDAFYAQHGQGIFARIAQLRRRWAQVRKAPKPAPLFARPAQVR